MIWLEELSQRCRSCMAGVCKILYKILICIQTLYYWGVTVIPKPDVTQTGKHSVNTKGEWWRQFEELPRQVWVYLFFEWGSTTVCDLICSTSTQEMPHLMFWNHCVLLHTKGLELQLTCRGTDAVSNNITAALDTQSKLQFTSQDGQEFNLNKGKGVKKEINSDAFMGS